MTCFLLIRSAAKSSAGSFVVLPYWQKQYHSVSVVTAVVPQFFFHFFLSNTFFHCFHCHRNACPLMICRMSKGHDFTWLCANLCFFLKTNRRTKSELHNLYKFMPLFSDVLCFLLYGVSLVSILKFPKNASKVLGIIPK